MNKLFKILDGIVSSEYAKENLESAYAVINYAEAAGEVISKNEAERIISVGQSWIDAQENGNGEWSRMRHEAMAALE